MDDRLLEEAMKFSSVAYKFEKAGDKSGAIPNRIMALNKLFECYGRDNAEVAEAYYRLGKLYIGRDYPKAVECLQEAVSIAEHTLLADSPSQDVYKLVAHMYQVYGTALANVNLHEEAASAHRRMSELQHKAGMV